MAIVGQGRKPLRAFRDQSVLNDRGLIHTKGRQHTPCLTALLAYVPDDPGPPPPFQGEGGVCYF